MPTVEKTAGGRVHVRGIGRFSIGDRADVSADEAAYLCEERGDFEYVHEPKALDDTPEPSIDEWHDWNEGDWLELDYEQRADDVQAGRVDEHLDEVIDCDRSTTVTEAANKRRDELED